MSALGIDIDLRPDYLEDHWGDECRCESKHFAVSAVRSVCSKKVVARLQITCVKGHSALWCANRVVEHDFEIAEGLTDCECGKPLADCWVVRAA